MGTDHPEREKPCLASLHLTVVKYPRHLKIDWPLGGAGARRPADADVRCTNNGQVSESTDAAPSNGSSALINGAPMLAGHCPTGEVASADLSLVSYIDRVIFGPYLFYMD